MSLIYFLGKYSNTRGSTFIIYNTGGAYFGFVSYQSCIALHNDDDGAEYAGASNKLMMDAADTVPAGVVCIIAAGDCFAEGGRGSDQIVDGSTSVLFSASAWRGHGCLYLRLSSRYGKGFSLR